MYGAVSPRAAVMGLISDDAAGRAIGQGRPDHGTHLITPTFAPLIPRYQG